MSVMTADQVQPANVDDVNEDTQLGYGLGQLWQEAFQQAQEHWLMDFPHEWAILTQRQLEVGSVVSALFMVHCIDVVRDGFAELSVLGLSTFRLKDCLCLVVCVARIICFFPKPVIWLHLHRKVHDARNQPTPQLMQAKLRVAMEWKPSGAYWLDVIYYVWLVIVPGALGAGASTEFALRLWFHYKAWVVKMLMMRILNIVLFLWLKNAKINRGLSEAILRQYTDVFTYRTPCDRLVWPECSICLQEYEPNSVVRMLRCGHHYHKKCIDTWLQQYVNFCPFCRALIGPFPSDESKRD